MKRRSERKSGVASASVELQTTARQVRLAAAVQRRARRDLRDCLRFFD